MVAGCGTPRVNGVAGASPSPSVPWTPPAHAIREEPLIAPAQTDAVPPDLRQRMRQLSLADVVDLALRNNPATRASWSQARAAADLLGSARGSYFPTVNGSSSLARIKSPATNARPAGIRTEYGPSVSLNYLLLDFGGRAGTVERARQNLFAANLSHNATIQNTVLQAQVAYFNYMATAALLAAERSAILRGAREACATATELRASLTQVRSEATALRSQCLLLRDRARALRGGGDY